MGIEVICFMEPIAFFTQPAAFAAAPLSPEKEGQHVSINVDVPELPLSMTIERGPEGTVKS